MHNDGCLSASACISGRSARYSCTDSITGVKNAKHAYDLHMLEDFLPFKKRRPTCIVRYSANLQTASGLVVYRMPGLGGRVNDWCSQGI